MPRDVQVELLSRVEGTGGLSVEVSNGKITKMEFRIFEAPRFFEGFLEGRHFDEVVDFVARICGICPISYQMAACNSLEYALQFKPSNQTRRLRRIFSWAEILQSNLLHVHMLAAPDYLGYESAAAMAKDHPDIVTRGLKLKRLSNDISKAVGGREVHPVLPRVTGFYSPPTREMFDDLMVRIENSLDDAEQVVRTMASLNIPEFERDVEFLCLSHPDNYALNEGNIVSTKGMNVPVDKFLDQIEEKQVPYSNAMQTYIKGRGSYMVGPLARVNINQDKMLDRTKSLIKELGLEFPTSNPYMSIVARALECLNGFDECYQLMDGFNPVQEDPEIKPRAGKGYGISEAPRGSLFHYYELDEQGLVTKARIIPPTSQNHFRVEDDLRLLIPTWLDHTDEEIAMKSEQAIRNYDPCISCSTHFLKFKMTRKS